MIDYIDKKNFWVSDKGIKGKSYKIKGFDLELENLEELEFSLDNFTKSLNENVRVKFSLFQDFIKSDKYGNDRSKDLLERGFLKSTRFIHFEEKKKVSFLNALTNNGLDIKEIESCLNNDFLDLVKKESLTSKDFKDFYRIEKPFQIKPYGLKTRNGLVGVLKLKNCSNYPVSLKTLSLILEQIPKPLEFHLSIEKISSFEGEKMIKHQSKMEKDGQGLVSYEKYKQAQSLEKDLELKGEDLFRYEIHIVLKRLRGKYLGRDLETAKRALSSFGEFEIESVGSIQSLKSLSPGHHLHYALFEVSKTLKCYFPLFSFGRSELESEEGLIFNRRDLSLDSFNPFNSSYSNHSGVIIGKSGKGKSVFTNILTKSLHNKKNFIFLIDVKGSHKKLVRLLEGKDFQIDIKNPYGFNPFKHLKNDKMSVEILSDFVEQLVLKEKEDSLPSLDKINLEKELIRFSKSEKDKTLDNFYKDFNHARKPYLSKWIKGGLSENFFKEEKLDIGNNNLIYFNFENINTASNSQISKAIISSIMAEFSFKLSNKLQDEKLFLICDETPFFIKNSFNSFSLLSKNLRKLYGSLILIAQNSKDLIVNEDTSLIDNSEFKILFSIDGKENSFKETFNLNESEFRTIKSLKMIKNRYSSFFLKDSIGSRVGFLRLSKREYIRSNTDALIQEKIKTLSGVLGVNEDKAMEILSYV